MSFRIALALLLAVSAAGTTAATAGNFGYSSKHSPDVAFPGKQVHRSPYPMSKAAAAVWHSDACFKDCSGQAGWQFSACLVTTSPEQCRVHLDADDRLCLRACRTRGGPLLNITD